MLQQRAGSSFLWRLNRGDQAPGPVAYTVIATPEDDTVTPWRSQLPPVHDSSVTNVVLRRRLRTCGRCADGAQVPAAPTGAPVSSSPARSSRTFSR